MELLKFVIINLVLATHALPKFFHGTPTTIDLPLKESGDRAETMKLTYWTSYLENKFCLRNPLPCPHEAMDAYIFGNLTIKNIDTR
jgi:hypothetical protein